jgi:DnaJ like chaperone protein
MAKKFHPDKLAHLGDDVQKAANEKFQKINTAYEAIKKERRMSIFQNIINKQSK